MSRSSFIALLVFGVSLLGVAAPETGLLLHYSFDKETEAGIVDDLSANGIKAERGVELVDSPLGKALRFDGSKTDKVSIKLPKEKYFGKKSWTFSAWLKPKQFTIESSQNQRRVFAFGKYPQAYMVIDINKSGAPISYFCYKTADGATHSMGTGSNVKFELGKWAYFVFSCDREKRLVSIYVNGIAAGHREISKAFDGDFSIGTEFTLGNGWHCYWGDMDEVKVYQRPVSQEEARENFKALYQTFDVEITQAMRDAERRALAAKAMLDAGAYWEKGDIKTAREQYRIVQRTKNMDLNVYSYLGLRIAQSYLAEKNVAAARNEYQQLVENSDLPEIHRQEARERLAELDREARGLPARDVTASRTKIPEIREFAATVHVAPDGDDANDGSAQKPFATLIRARDALRELRKTTAKGALRVLVAPGKYRVTETLVLGEEDSGTAESPVVYQAEEVGKSMFYGGATLDSKAFSLVKDSAILQRLPAEGRGKVMQFDLRAAGITDYGELQVRGFGQPASPPTLELYFNNSPMTVSRWPNQGFVPIDKLVEPGSLKEGKPSVISYIDPRHERWTQAEDLWLFGYFKFLWADSTIKIAKIDTEAKTLTTEQAYKYGGSGMQNRQGIQYYAFNLLEELDQPGEWYLNRSTGMLYFLPPADITEAKVEIGMFSAPMVEAENVNFLRLQGFTFDLGRYKGLCLRNCSDSLIAGCTVSRMAHNGVEIHGGYRNGLFGCDIRCIGRRASEVIGGQRETLTPGNHFVENCRLSHFGRIDRTYTPAIQLEGVGNHVAHNLMYNCPSSAMRIEGNEHLIEYNDVFNVVFESDDQGAMELFANPTYRGVIFRYNRYRDIGKTGSEKAVHGQAAIRFDDAISGMLVYSNIFIRSSNGHFGAVQMNSGRDNLMDNNLFIDCKYGISGGWRSGNNVWKGIRAGNPRRGIITNELYLSRYPRIGGMAEGPAYNNVWRNVFYRCGTLARSTSGLDLFENANFEEENPGFANPDEDDYRFAADSKLLVKTCFRPIPVEEIGNYQTPLNAWGSAPAPKSVRMQDWRK